MDKQSKAAPQAVISEPANILSLDISSVKVLQIGYQAETIFLHKTTEDSLTIKEYINYHASEYFAKITANRFKTTIRYGRREEVNMDSYVEVFLPENWSGELSISSQYGNIHSEDDWNFERFTAESSEGSIRLKSILAPRIRITTSMGPIQIEHAQGFTDIHSVSGAIIAYRIDGGAKLATSSAPIFANFESLNNIIECNTLNGDIQMALPENTGMKIDGISKTGDIQSEIDGITIKTKPGNIKNITGILGEKPYQDVRISTINGNITLNY